jgi:hypothetical protein
LIEQGKGRGEDGRGGSERERETPFFGGVFCLRGREGVVAKEVEVKDVEVKEVTELREGLERVSIFAYGCKVHTK